MMTVVTHTCCLCAGEHPPEDQRLRARRLLYRLMRVLLPWPGMRLLLEYWLAQQSAHLENSNRLILDKISLI